MWQPRQTGDQFFSVAVLVSTFAGAGIISLAIGSRYAFSAFWTVAPLGILALLIALVASFRRERGPAAICFIAFNLVAGWSVRTIPEMFPLEWSVPPASFDDVPVSDVLSHLAQGRQKPPYLGFLVSDRKLGERRVTMDLLQNASLGHALHLLTEKTGASYTSEWRKACGGEAAPLCASFHFSHDDASHVAEYQLIVDREGKLDLTTSRGDATVVISPIPE